MNRKWMQFRSFFFCYMPGFITSKHSSISNVTEGTLIFLCRTDTVASHLYHLLCLLFVTLPKSILTLCAITVILFFQSSLILGHQHENANVKTILQGILSVEKRLLVAFFFPFMFYCILVTGNFSLFNKIGLVADAMHSVWLIVFIDLMWISNFIIY